jgi:hypothetical protein
MRVDTSKVGTKRCKKGIIWFVICPHEWVSIGLSKFGFSDPFNQPSILFTKYKHATILSKTTEQYHKVKDVRDK